jgi:Ca2+-binding RTX toxin-like protein
MRNPMFTYIASKFIGKVQRVRGVALATSAALFAGLIVTIGAGPSIAQTVDPSVLCGMCLTEPSLTSVSVAGSSKVTVNGGGVYANSSAAPAMSVTGSSKIVTNAQVRAVGTIVKTGSSTISGSPASGLTAPLFADPYPGRAPVVSVGPNNATIDFNQSNGAVIPVRADATYRDVTLNGSGTFTFPDAHRYRDVVVGGSVTAILKPGRYRNVTFGGSSKITLSPGIYWFAGSLSVTSSSKVTGTDASLVLACGTPTNDLRACNDETGGKLLVTGSSQLTLNGNTPTTPAIRFVPGNNADLTVDGSSKLVLANSGIDAPNTPIIATGSSSITTSGVIQARRVSITGSSAITSTVIPAPPSTTTTTLAASTTTSPTTSTITTSSTPTATSTTTIPASTSTSSSTTTTIAAGTTTTSTTITSTSTSTTSTTTSVPPSAVDVAVDAMCLKANAIRGTDGIDELVGTPGQDTICGLGGNDTIRGLGGDDFLIGGPGNDLVFGGEGTDWILGGEGVDTLNGEAGADAIWGGAGDDVIDGGENGDSISGDIGNDHIVGGLGSDSLNGGSNDDQLLGGEDDDRLTGGPGIDFADAGLGDDRCVEAETVVSCELDPLPAPPATITKSAVDGGPILEVQSPGGIAAGDITIAPAEAAPILPLAIGPVFELSNDSGVPFSSAKLTFNIPAGVDPDQVDIYTYDETVFLWELVEGTQLRNAAGRTISVDLQHFSLYGMASRPLPERQKFHSLRCMNANHGAETDVAILVDASGSTDTYDPADTRYAAAQTIISRLPKNTLVTIEEFDSESKQLLAQQLSGAGLENAYLELSGKQGGFGGTGTTGALRKVFSVLAARNAGYSAVFLISDGDVVENASDIQSIVALAKQKDIPLHLIDLNPQNPSTALLSMSRATEGLQANPDGAYPSGGELSDERVQDLTTAMMNNIFDPGYDADKDGITDCEEVNGSIVIHQSNTGTPRYLVKSDVGNPDQDGDQLFDGDELRRVGGKERSRLPIVSATEKDFFREPRILRSSIGTIGKNSDGDIFPDRVERELELELNPLAEDAPVEQFNLRWSLAEIEKRLLLDGSFTNDPGAGIVFEACDILDPQVSACRARNRSVGVRLSIINKLRKLGAWDKKNMVGARTESLAGLLLFTVLNWGDAKFGKQVAAKFLGMNRAERIRTYTAKYGIDALITPTFDGLSLEDLIQVIVFAGGAAMVVLTAGFLIQVSPALVPLVQGLVGAAAEAGAPAAVAALYVSAATGGLVSSSAVIGGVGVLLLACGVVCPDDVQNSLDIVTGVSVNSQADEAIEVAKKLAGGSLVKEIDSVTNIGKRLLVYSEVDAPLTKIDDFGTTALSRALHEDPILDAAGNAASLVAKDDVIVLEASEVLVNLVCTAATAIPTASGGRIFGFSVGFAVPTAPNATCNGFRKIPRNLKLLHSKPQDLFLAFVRLKASGLSAWTLGFRLRGYLLEAALLKRLKTTVSGLSELPYAFKTIDAYVPNVSGIASQIRSIKSTNTIGKTTTELRAIWGGYAKSLGSFTEWQKSGVLVETDVATVRVLDLVVPKGQETLQEVVDAVDRLALAYPKLLITLQSSDL